MSTNLDRLPKAEVIPEFSKAEGVVIGGAFLRNSLVNHLSGSNVPTVTYTIGVQGRGSLVVEEQEFRDLLASMIAVFDDRAAARSSAA